MLQQLHIWKSAYIRWSWDKYETSSGIWFRGSYISVDGHSVLIYAEPSRPNLPNGYIQYEIHVNGWYASYTVKGPIISEHSLKLNCNKLIKKLKAKTHQ